MNDSRVKNALDEIGRAQVAYDEYVKAGRQDLADIAHAYAVEKRNLLGSLGVSSSYYNEDVDLRQRYSATGPAGQYDPSKPGVIERPSTVSSAPSASGAAQQTAGGAAGTTPVTQNDLRVQIELSEIGRAQKAYDEYQLAGRQDLANLCNKYANEQRDVLKSLGADSSWYNENVDLRSKWTGAGHAGQYNPYKTGQAAGVIGIATPLSDSRVQTMLDSIGRAQTAYDEYTQYNRQADLGKEAQDYANSIRAQLWDLGVDPVYYNADVNLRSRWKGGVAGDYDPSKPGKVLRPQLDPKQAELNRQLVELKKQWWTARFDFNSAAMTAAEAAAVALRKQGAQETDETLKLDNQNGVIWSNKIAYYDAKANLDSAGMNNALDAIAKARQYGGTIATDNTRLDQLNNQIYQAKVDKWNAIAFEDQAARQKAIQSSNAARSEMNADIRLSGSLITDEDTQLDIQNRLKLDAKRDWWNAWATGNMTAMTTAENKGSAATARGATVTDSKMDQMNNIIWEAKKSWWKAKAEGDWAAMEQASRTADAAYGNGSSFTKDSTLEFDRLNAQLLAVKTQYWTDYANNASGQINPADYQNKMNNIANHAAFIYKSGLITSTVSSYKVDELNKAIIERKTAYWEAKAVGNTAKMINMQLTFVKSLQSLGTCQVIDPVTKQPRTEVYVDGLIDDNKIKLKFEAYNEQLLNARNTFKQHVNSGNYVGALEDLNRIITAKKSGATISHVYTTGVGQSQLVSVLYEAKKMYWNSVADLNKAEEDKAAAIGTLLKASQTNGGFGVSENDERIVNLDKQNSLMLAAKHDYWDAILHMDKNQMSVAKSAMVQAHINGATISASPTTKIDEANRQIIEQKLNYWQNYKGSANSNNPSAVAKQWRDTAKTIEADEYVLSNEDQDNDPYMVQYGKVEKRVASTTNRVSYGANGAVTYTPVTTYRTISIAGYQSVYNADTGQYSAQTAASGSSHQLDQLLNELYQAKVSKWSATAALATTNSPLVPDILRSQTAAENRGIDLRNTLNTVLASAGFSLAMDWTIDTQNTAVMDSYASITNNVNSGKIAAAQTEFDNAGKRLAQGATIDIGQMMARPVVKEPVPASPQAGDLLSATQQIIFENEGDYGTVNPNDGTTVKALSIGKLQWHAERAFELLNRIKNAAPQQAKELLSGTTIYDELNGNSSSWKARTVSAKEAAAISALLETEVGKAAQVEQARTDVQTYLEVGKRLGISDNGALIYFADLYNQRPASAIAIINNAGGGNGLSLERIHSLALVDPTMGNYTARRTATYEKAKNFVSQTSGSHSGTVPAGATGYNGILDSNKYNLEEHYLADANGTYCNVFTRDVMREMGAFLPNGLANDIAKWLGTDNAVKEGWKQVTAKEAQEAANAGKPTIVAWENTGTADGGHGHLAVVRPYKNGEIFNDNDIYRSVVLASAGGSNYNYITLNWVFNKQQQKEVKFYIHT